MSFALWRQLFGTKKGEAIEREAESIASNVGNAVKVVTNDLDAAHTTIVAINSVKPTPEGTAAQLGIENAINWLGTHSSLKEFVPSPTDNSPVAPVALTANAFNGINTSSGSLSALSATDTTSFTPVTSLNDSAN